MNEQEINTYAAAVVELMDGNILTDTSRMYVQDNPVPTENQEDITEAIAKLLQPTTEAITEESTVVTPAEEPVTDNASTEAVVEDNN